MVWSSANVVSIWDMFGEELIVLVGLVVGGSVVCCNRPQRSALQDEGGCLVDAWRLYQRHCLSRFFNCTNSGSEVKCVLSHRRRPGDFD